MKNIALIDPHTGGHHVGFMQMFAHTLLRQGYRVFLYTPEYEQIEAWISAQEDINKADVVVMDYRIQPLKQYSKYNQYRLAWQILHRWQQVGKMLRHTERAHNLKMDFVFFAWLDDYLSSYLHGRLLDIFFKYRWSGLYFHPRFLRLNPPVDARRLPSLSEIDVALTAKNCTGIAVHDEGIVARYQQRLHKPVYLFPETADGTPPASPHLLADVIRTRANGRTVIGTVGLEKHKGTLTLIRLAKQANPQHFFFVLVGNVQEVAYTPSEIQELRDFFGHLPENCFYHDQALREGADYNAVFCAFDIPFLVYNDFTSSSNRLTKASIFKRYVLAHNKYCVAEDIEKYGLGLTVEAENVAQCLEAIEILRHKILNEPFPTEAFEVYRRLHSLEMLDVRFRELLADTK